MKSYFSLGVFVALSWIGLGAGAQAQQPDFSSPSLLPLSEVQPEYPTTQFPEAPVGAYGTGVPGSSSSPGPAYGQRVANSSSAIVSREVLDANPTPATDAPQNGPYMDAMSAPYGSGCAAGAEGCGAACGSACTYGGGCCSNGWWASAGGLIMGRDLGNRHNFSFFDLNEAAQFTTQQYNWGGGVQASVGKCICGGQYGLEAVYWGLYPGVNEQNTLAGAQPGNLNAILNFNQLNYNGGLASLSTNNAVRHRLQADYEIHNVEFNFLNFGYGGLADYSRASFNFGAGVRWFRFRDGLQFASDPTDAVFTGAANELFYDISTTNDLVGFQLTGQGNYWLTNRLNASLGTKFGLYGNHVQHHSRIGGSAGDAVINNGPFNGRAWNVNSTSDTVAFLGELDAGLTYAIGSRWSLFGGYRIMAASNVALTTNQIFPDLRGINDVESINHNGSLILHGAYAGAQFTW